MSYGRLIYFAVVIGLIVLAYKYNPQFFRGFWSKNKGNPRGFRPLKKLSTINIP